MKAALVIAVLAVLAAACAAQRPSPPPRPTRPTHGTRAPGPPGPPRPTRAPLTYCDDLNVQSNASCTKFCADHGDTGYYRPISRPPQQFPDAQALCCCLGDSGSHRTGECCIVAQNGTGHGGDDQNATDCSASTSLYRSCDIEVVSATGNCMKQCEQTDDDDDDDANHCFACIQSQFKNKGEFARCCPCIYARAKQLNQPNMQIDC